MFFLIQKYISGNFIERDTELHEHRMYSAYMNVCHADFFGKCLSVGKLKISTFDSILICIKSGKLEGGQTAAVMMSNG